MAIAEDLIRLHEGLIEFCSKMQLKSATKYKNESHIEKKVFYVLGTISSYAVSLHNATFSLYEAGWVQVTPILIRTLLECNINLLVIINSNNPEYMAFKYLYHQHIRFFRDKNFPENLREKAKRKIEQGIQDLDNPKLREGAKKFAYEEKLKRFWFQPEVKNITKILNSYGGKKLKLKYVYGMLSWSPHAQYFGILLFKDDLDSIDIKPSYSEGSDKKAFIFSGLLLLSLFKSRNDFEGLEFESEYSKLVKKFEFDNEKED